MTDTHFRTRLRILITVASTSYKAPHSTDRLLENADDFARRDPAKAVAAAFGAGLLIHVLPLKAITSLLVSLLFALACPALLLLGVMKTFDLARAKSGRQQGHSDSLPESETVR